MCKSVFFISFQSLKTVGKSIKSPWKVLKFYTNLTVWSQLIRIHTILKRVHNDMKGLKKEGILIREKLVHSNLSYWSKTKSKSGASLLQSHVRFGEMLSFKVHCSLLLQLSISRALSLIHSEDRISSAVVLGLVLSLQAFWVTIEVGFWSKLIIVKSHWSENNCNEFQLMHFYAEGCITEFENKRQKQQMLCYYYMWHFVWVFSDCKSTCLQEKPRWCSFKPLSLYPGVPSSIPGSSSLSDETLSHGSVSIWP